MSRFVTTLVIVGMLLLLESASSSTETSSFTSAGSREVAKEVQNNASQANQGPVRGINDEELTMSHEPIPLGQTYTMSRGPGVLVGTSWYDMQHNGSMGRMIDWGYTADSGLIVHFSWMELTTSAFINRKYGYNAYRAGSGTFLGEVSIQPDGEYAGYVGIDVADDNCAVVIGHNNQGAGYQSHAYFQDVQGGAAFGTESRVPDSVAWSGGYIGQEVNWPKFRLQEVPGHDPVLHVIAQVSGPVTADPQAIYYFRQSPAGVGGTWDYPSYVIDTVFDIAQDIVCSNTDGKVALIWIANRPNDGDCDTCSSNDGQEYRQFDNDLYYQLSYDYGVTFQPRVNLTKNVDGVEGYRPYTDLSALITTDNDLHIAWNDTYWPADASSGGNIFLLGVMSHWGENLGFDAEGRGNVVEAVNLEWKQIFCTSGAWQLNGSKMSLSECNGKLYYLYVQFNDIPAGVSDDCSFHGYTNGELFLTVSSDSGQTWDVARNLTNTYTPNCQPGDCASEHWPSMAKFGTDHGGNMSGSIIVDPSGTYSGDHFLDVQYIDDPDAGAYVHGEGTLQEVGVRWFRLACVEPVLLSTFEPSWSVIEWPTWTQHGVALDTQLVVTNSGNSSTNFALTIEEDPGPYSGWLTLSSELQGSVTCPAGLANTVTGTVTLNTGGMVNNSGTVVHLGGRLIAIGNQMTNPDTLPIDIWVLDTTNFPAWDTISTGCLALTISNHGNFGNMGDGHVNMDFFDYGDCDDLEGDQDFIPGDATIYLFDASPVICWPDGDSVRCNWSIFGDGFPCANGFLPLAEERTVDSGDFYYYQSEFTTRDSGIGVRQSWYAPKDQPDSCQFLIQRLRVFSYDE
ncbi:MAG: hypothetical protein KAW91_04065, partial [candidate division Zixibacteria bacterium]|nr:hypothetical protein [candidate division Zixibacteria bacterium]